MTENATVTPVPTGTGVTVVGAGIAGAACAVALQAAGIDVVVRDRGRAPGGRLASPTLHGRRVDLGAAYLTVSDDRFAAVAERWRGTGLARPWTDTLEARTAGRTEAKTGPVRWAAPDGLRSLARDLLARLGADRVRQSAPVDDLAELEDEGRHVVLAMPDPQAARLLGADALDWVAYDPVIAVAAGWDERCWDLRDAAFVNGDPDLTLVADDGARRGDGAPVLVLHSSAERAAEHLADPDAAVAPMLAALARVLDLGAAPAWTHAHRWTFAKPAAAHDQPYAMLGPVSVCGDSWCPSGAPRVESAWLSGTRLGEALAGALAG